MIAETDVYLWRIRHWVDGELEADYLSHDANLAVTEAEWDDPNSGIETQVTIVTLPPTCRYCARHFEFDAARDAHEALHEANAWEREHGEEIPAPRSLAEIEAEIDRLDIDAGYRFEEMKTLDRGALAALEWVLGGGEIDG